MKSESVRSGLRLVIGCLAFVAAMSAQAVDFYWNKAVADGNWEDVANWCTDSACTVPATVAPSTGNDVAYFKSPQKTVVRINGSVTAKSIDCSAADLDLTFCGAGVDATSLSLATLNLSGTGGRVSFENLAVSQTGTSDTTVGSGRRLVIDRGASITTKRQIITTASGAFEVRDGAVATINHNLVVGGGDKDVGGVIVSNATLVVTGHANVGSGKSGGSIRLEGDRPKLLMNTAKKGLYSSLANAGSHLDFLVPVGGYAEPPVVCTLSTAYPMGNSNVSTPGSSTIAVNVLADSPAARVDDTVTCGLVIWAPGINTDMVLEGSLPVEAAGSAFAWDGAPDKAPTNIAVTVVGSAHHDRLDIVSAVGEYCPDEVSAAYGRHPNLAAGEKVVCTAPAGLQNVSNDVRVTCTGWKLFVRDPATHARTLVDEGAATSYTYEHDGNWHELEWQWTQEFLVAASAGAGGSVSPATHWVTNGCRVAVTATPDAGKAIRRWSGFVTGPVRWNEVFSERIYGPAVIEVSFGNAVYIKAAGGNDTSGNGSAELPYQTIAKAVGVAADGDTILLMPGTHTVSAVVTLGRELRVRSQTGRVEDAVVLFGAGTAKMLTLSSADACLDRLTIDGNRQSSSTSNAGAVHITGGRMVDCVIRNVLGSATGHGITAVYANGADAFVGNCVISNNTGGCTLTDSGASIALALNGGARAEGCLVTDNCANACPDNSWVGGVAVKNGTLVNCTVVNNRGLGTGGVRVTSGSVINCVIAGNVSTGCGNAFDNIYPDTDAKFTRCAFSGAPVAGTDCISEPFAEAFFADYAAHDYRPRAGGALVDAGLMETTLRLDLAGTVRECGAAPDLGCFETDPSVLGVTLQASVPRAFAPYETVVSAAVSGFGEDARLSYAWRINGGEPFVTATDAFTTNLMAAGAYDVSVTVTDAVTGRSVSFWRTGLAKAYPAVMRVITGNAGAAFPYDTDANAAASLAEALACAIPGSVIELARGIHDIPDPVDVVERVTIRGETGDPTDVVLRSKTGNKMLRISNPRTLVTALAIDGNLKGGDKTPLLFIDTNGGTASNCVIRNYSHASTHVSMPVQIIGADSLLTHSVVSNMTGGASNDSDMCIGLTVDSGARAENCLIAGNSCTRAKDSTGIGGVQVRGGTLANCTVTGNSSVGVGGVRVTSGSVVNCVIVGNSSTGKGTGYENVYPGTDASFSHCAFDLREVTGEGCVWEELPSVFFADYAHGDFTPVKGGALVDAGADGATAAVTDFAGNARVMGAAIDIGAWEYDPNAFGVALRTDVPQGFAPCAVSLIAEVSGVREGDATAFTWRINGGEPFTTEGNAVVTNLAAGKYTVAVTLASGGKETSDEKTDLVRLVPRVMRVIVGNAGAAFPYDTDANAAATLADALAATIPDGIVELAAGEHELSATVEMLEGKTIRGETGNPADVVVKAATKDRMFHLVNPKARLEALTVDLAQQGCIDNGAGVYVDAGGGTVSNCVVCNHKVETTHVGTAAYLTGASSLITHSVVSNNLCGSNNDSNVCPALSLASSARAENCLVVGNTCTKSNSSSAPGGVYVNGGVLANCTVLDNSSVGAGGVKVAAGSVVNCVIAGNLSALGVENDNLAAGTDASFSHCAFDRIASGDGSCVWEEQAAAFFADYAHGDFTPVKGGALVDAGAAGATAAATDIAGKDRVMGEAIDIGAWEYDPHSFAVSLRTDVPQGFAPCTVSLIAETSGVREGDATAFTWRINGGEPFTTGENTVVTNLAAGEYTVAVTLESEGRTATDEKRDLVRIVPRVMRVIAGNAGAAFPYDTDANAAADVQDALAATIPYGIVELAAGEHPVSATIELTESKTIRGATGNPADAVLKAAAGVRLAHLVNAGARLESLTLDCAEKGCIETGAGVYVDTAGGMVSNCIVRNHYASTTHAGAAVYARGAQSLVTHCVITNNAGGSNDNMCMALVLAASARCENSLIAGNNTSRSSTTTQPPGPGGADVTSATLANCTVVANRAKGIGGVRVSGSGGAVVNCVIVDNVTDGLDGKYGNADPDAAEFFTACAFDRTPVAGEKCVCEETPMPYFTDYANADFTPVNGGKLVDGGVADATAASVDIAGRLRVKGEAIDIGAWEHDSDEFAVTLRASSDGVFLGVPVTVTAETSGVGGDDLVEYAWEVNGAPAFRTDANSFTTNFALGVYDIRVTAENKTTGLTTADDRPGLVRVVPRVMRVVAGNAGAAFPYDTDANAASNVQDAVAATIPGGIIELAPGEHLVSSTIEIAEAKTVRGATGKSADAVLKAATGVRLVHLLNSGARIESLTLDCAEKGCISHGAAVYVAAAGGTVSNCVIRNHRADTTHAGSAAYLTGANALITHCIVTNNYGGSNDRRCDALCLEAGARGENSLIAGNTSTRDTEPGGVDLISSTLVNCTVAGNRALGANGVGGIRVSDDSMVLNCAIAGNVTTGHDETWNNVNPDKYAVFTSCVFDGTTIPGFKCVTVGSSDELFRNFARGDYRPKKTGALVEGAEKGSVPGETDLAGRQRRIGPRPDIGCYEYPSYGLQLIVR